MALETTFAVRQFYNIPSGYGTFTSPAGTFVVTGSISRLLVNNTRTNLANDSMTITTQFDGPYVANSGTITGWWPGSTTFANVPADPGDILQGIIAGGNDEYENTSSDGRTSRVSCWGFAITASAESANNQPDLDIEFRSLAGNILGTTYANVNLAKTALRNAGYYYQYPMGFLGQSPNTGEGSDV